ncbi:exo-beta-N-acetylmuramidase NamZ family protein [Sphingobacterium suaedae]|uniref:Exo-beta-N-acetylmuramidase NamZ domain-containing protein n=1 Tax=Sphingobacterium suaedae TaxID=1686402 RepID=A0ABW5KPF1_9SPHI
MRKITSILCLIFLISHVGICQIRTGADQVPVYIDYLKNKKIAMVVNPTSRIGNQSSVDSLLSLGVNIVKVFGPEHGFRGNVGAGVHVNDSIDSLTGVQVVSLYGRTNKPTKEMLQDIDLVIFDIQDIGVRYFTYIGTMHRVMEACAENGKELLILDRPNPNGYFVDGPILDMKHSSGIGMHPVPITHGMTVGEYAQMINGEGWLANGMQCKIKVIPVANYSHDMEYIPPVHMSPNINTYQAVLLYPSTCLFEGTILSEGRGTHFPFTVIGSPALKGIYDFSFTPISIKGMSATPIYRNETCYGLDLRQVDLKKLRATKKINLSWLIETYHKYPNRRIFFDNKQSKEIVDFKKLAGGLTLERQILAGLTEDEIRKSWEPGLKAYNEMRKKYMLYP